MPSQLQFEMPMQQNTDLTHRELGSFAVHADTALQQLHNEGLRDQGPLDSASHCKPATFAVGTKATRMHTL
jgi:hypothetical protein